MSNENEKPGLVEVVVIPPVEKIMARLEAVAAMAAAVAVDAQDLRSRR